MITDFEAVVVGAGVIGLAIARQLAFSGRLVLVLEKAARAGTETSSRNSEVIHAGIYYPAGTLKAMLCVQGRKLLYDYCASHGVKTRRIGKLIVATSTDEEAKLMTIASLAAANSVDDLQWLSQADVRQREPELRCTKALFSPSTGIIDATGFMLALQGEAESHGASFAFNTQFKSARKATGIFIVSAAGVGGKTTEVTCQTLINCAGHGTHDVAMSVEGYCSASLPPRYLAKGSYCNLSGRTPFKHLIYPVPVSGALGIHATLDVNDAVRFGPDIQWVDKIDYLLPSGLPEKFSAAVESYWPAVRDYKLTSSYCGIRPKLHDPSQGFADFQIQLHKDHGVANLVNLFGIESPGLTAALAIAALLDRSLASIEGTHMAGCK